MTTRMQLYKRLQAAASDAATCLAAVEAACKETPYPRARCEILQNDLKAASNRWEVLADEYMGEGAQT